MLTGIGDQLPEIPLLDVVGRGGIVAPLQYGPACVNVGTVGVVMVMVDVPVAGQPGKSFAVTV